MEKHTKKARLPAAVPGAGGVRAVLPWAVRAGSCHTRPRVQRAGKHHPAQRPKLTAVSADGLNNYFTSYTRYVKDQVFGRDEWISLQSAAETALFQKTERRHPAGPGAPDVRPALQPALQRGTRALPKNLTAALESLCQRYPGRVNLMLVPSASVVYPENVPAGAPLLR